MGLDIESLLISALAVIIGIVIHESAHALAAYALGDKTARSRGRVSLNPLKLLMIAAGGPVFAFAKPVPIYLGNLKHPKRDELLISLAGPASNIVLACLGALLLSGVVNGSVWATAAGSIVAEFALTFIFVNLSLAFFNLIPLPPLDGSSILVPFLKGEALNAYYRIQQYAMPILIVVLYLLPMLTGIDLIDIYFDFTVYPLGDALLSFALA